MRFSEFSAEAAEQLAAFGRWWAGNRADLPVDYPVEMEERDWWEQFRAWLDLGGNSDG